MGYDDRELSIRFADDHEMTRLNRRYLGRKGSTNVISFPMEEPDGSNPEGPLFDSPMLGDVVICVDEAAREARVVGEPVEETLDRLLIHGVLHLIGYDHETSERHAEEMVKEEKRLMSLVKEV
ncbi:MAG: rRNA maturation RNase YbeY [Desulfatiglandaceae bacterium]